ncbi:MAG: hypothetical protein ACLRFE_00275 [Clostridia bacterium]
MRKPKLIEKRIKDRQSKELDKPQYKIKDLYTANEVMMPLGEHSINKYFPIKDFAICRLCPCCNEYRVINDSTLPNVYICKEVHPFSLTMAKYMEDNNLNENSKLSFRQIQQIEHLYTKDQQHMIIFN